MKAQQLAIDGQPAKVFDPSTGKTFVSSIKRVPSRVEQIFLTKIIRNLPAGVRWGISVEEKIMIGKISYSVTRACILFMLLSFITQLTRAQRDSSEGESWLRWSSEHRNAYVAGYIEGYYGGYVHGCQEGTRHLPEPPQPGFDNFPVNKCMDRKLDFTKGIDLTKDVTARGRAGDDAGLCLWSPNICKKGIFHP